jgi:hypothetical protein
MGANIHEPHRFGKTGEVASLGRLEWVLLEKRDDASAQIGKTSDAVAPHVLPVIVVATIHCHHSASKEPLQCVKDIHTTLALRYRELRLSLPAQSACRVAKDRNAETALAVDEADDPLCSKWPFLLIVRTGRIITRHVLTLRRASDRNQYRRILGVSSIQPTALPGSLLGGADPGTNPGVYLRHICYSSPACATEEARSFLPGSACRHAGRTVSSSLPATLGVQSLRILTIYWQ